MGLDLDLHEEAAAEHREGEEEGADDGRRLLVGHERADEHLCGKCGKGRGR